ncbi:hypothetical protein BC827DRAFT_1085409, partial [Russula dissimulans]
MLKAAKKQGTNLAALKMTPTIQVQLPVWYHLASRTRPMNMRASKCLLEMHDVISVVDLLKHSNRKTNQNQITPHQENRRCMCHDCMTDCINGCKNPNACTEEALIRIYQIYPKINPIQPRNVLDNLSLTGTRKARNQVAKHKNGKILFDPTLTCQNNLGECFHTFADLDKVSKILPTRHQPQGTNTRYRETEIYTDGVCFQNGKKNAKSRAGIWFGPEDERNQAIRVLGQEQSNQIGEIVAIIKALEETPHFIPITIKTD